MKLTKEQIERLEKSIGDWEIYHGVYDKILEDIVKQTHPDFYDELQKIVKKHNAIFWYA